MNESFDHYFTDECKADNEDPLLKKGPIDDFKDFKKIITALPNEIMSEDITYLIPSGYNCIKNSNCHKFPQVSRILEIPSPQNKNFYYTYRIDLGDPRNAAVVVNKVAQTYTKVVGTSSSQNTGNIISFNNVSIPEKKDYSNSTKDLPISNVKKNRLDPLIYSGVIDMGPGVGLRINDRLKLGVGAGATYYISRNHQNYGITQAYTTFDLTYDCKFGSIYAGGRVGSKELKGLQGGVIVPLNKSSKQ